MLQLHLGNREDLPDWGEYVLVVPVVSCGNVGQLAADLLIATLELRPLGSLHHASLLPAAGATAFAHAPGHLSSGLELFADPDRKLACLQQRAPAAPGRQVELAQATAAWISRSGFKQVWVLGSLDAVFRSDGQLGGPQLRYWSPEAALSAACEQQGLPALEPEWFQRAGDKPLAERLLPPWPLLRELQAANLRCAALLTFSLEGDNRPEAYLLAGVAAGALGLAEPAAAPQQERARAAEDSAALVSIPVGGRIAWREPSSWDFAFGRSDRFDVY